jgi:hypothetical protein
MNDANFDGPSWAPLPPEPPKPKRMSGFFRALRGLGSVLLTAIGAEIVDRLRRGLR